MNKTETANNLANVQKNYDHSMAVVRSDLHTCLAQLRFWEARFAELGETLRANRRMALELGLDPR